MDRGRAELGLGAGEWEVCGKNDWIGLDYCSHSDWGEGSNEIKKFYYFFLGGKKKKKNLSSLYKYNDMARNKGSDTWRRIRPRALSLMSRAICNG